MADSFSTFLQVRLPATGAYNNTWGATLNSDAFNLLDTAITGWTALSIGASVAYSMPALNQGSSSTALYFCLYITGSPAAAATITLPSNLAGKFYLINNQTGQPLTFTYAGSTFTATVPNGSFQLIWCDGTNVYAPSAGALSASQLNGIPAANWLRQSRTAAEILAATVVLNSCTIPTAWPFTTVTEAPTTTVDCNNGNSQILTLTGNRIMAAPTNPRDGMEIDLWVVQDGTGSRTLTWNAIFLFASGLTPTLSNQPGAIDRFLIKYNQALNKWACGQFAGISTPAGATTNVSITGGGVDVNLFALMGNPGGVITVNVTIGQGVVITASCAKTAALDLSGFASGSTINLTNLGYIIGKGGEGGSGASAADYASGASAKQAQDGRPGGPAILGPGLSRTFNITNANGHIWGGGGGGGGGGATCQDGGSAFVGNGGGGGGGAGGGRGGYGGDFSILNASGGIAGSGKASPGGDGSAGVSGTNGSAGAGASAGSSAGSAGGAGGTYGNPGVVGANNTTYTDRVGLNGTFGAAGKAIELSGAAAPTFVSGSGAPNVLGLVS